LGWLKKFGQAQNILGPVKGISKPGQQFHNKDVDEIIGKAHGVKIEFNFFLASF
jgi:hypothetical protein